MPVATNNMSAFVLFLLLCDFSEVECRYVPATTGPFRSYEQCVDEALRIVRRERWHGYACEERSRG